MAASRSHNSLIVNKCFSALSPSAILAPKYFWTRDSFEAAVRFSYYLSSLLQIFTGQSNACTSNTTVGDIACVSLTVASTHLSSNASTAGLSAPSASVSSPFTKFHNFLDRSWCRICTFHEAQFVSPCNKVTRTLSWCPPVAIVLHTVKLIAIENLLNLNSSKLSQFGTNRKLSFSALRSWAHNLLKIHTMDGSSPTI